MCDSFKRHCKIKATYFILIFRLDKDQALRRSINNYMHTYDPEYYEFEGKSSLGHSIYPVFSHLIEHIHQRVGGHLVWCLTRFESKGF